ILSSGEGGNDHHMQDKQHSSLTINDCSSALDNDAFEYQEYYDNEHDNTITADDIEYCFLDRSPPLYNAHGKNFVTFKCCKTQ
ncbi:unnamed protein product, partial [Rotaria sordida]